MVATAVSTARAERLFRKAFNGGADGIVSRRGGRQIEAEVGPAALDVHAEGERFHVGGLLKEEIDQTAPGGRGFRGVLESARDGAGGFKPDRELVAGAGEVGRGKEGGVRRHTSESGKAEISFAVRRGVP